MQTRADRGGVQTVKGGPYWEGSGVSYCWGVLECGWSG